MAGVEDWRGFGVFSSPDVAPGVATDLSLCAAGCQPVCAQAMCAMAAKIAAVAPLAMKTVFTSHSFVQRCE
jgi:hypothetical protein